MSVENLILFFVKYPEPGKVKTRLAKTLGIDRAAEIYGELVNRNLKTFEKLSSKKFAVAIVFAPQEKDKHVREWLPLFDHYIAQQGSDLGERLNAAFDKGFRLGYRKVMAVGSDTLGLEERLIEKASESLEEANVVIGPANDGGYYLLGLKEGQAGIFRNISWSSRFVLEQTLERVRQLKLTFQLLEPLDDLDEMNDAIKGAYREIFNC